MKYTKMQPVKEDDETAPIRQTVEPKIVVCTYNVCWKEVPSPFPDPTVEY